METATPLEANYADVETRILDRQMREARQQALSQSLTSIFAQAIREETR
jgi:hypothetical protein